MRLRFTRRRVVIALSLLGVMLLVALGSAERYRRQNFTNTFIQRKGDLVSVEESLLEETPTRRIYLVELRDDRGLTVRCTVQVPANAQTPTTTLFLLGGLRTGRRTLEYIDGVDEVVLVAIDYPYDGKKSGLGVIEFLAALPSIHRALMNTVPACMLAIDYLLTREEVDPERIVVIGGSLGAIFGPALTAADDRVAALALLFGAGDLRALMAANLDMPPVVATPVSWLGAVITSPFEPLKYIGQVSPRPVFMLNGIEDSQMPVACSRLLHAAAGEPKTVRIIEAGHVDIRSSEFHGMVRMELEEWLRVEGLLATTRPE